MLKVLASTVAAAAVALAAAGAAAAPTPKPAASPFALGTLEPFAGGSPGPVAQPLPEIGRTRSVSPACAAMRDLVVPSWSAAQRADKRFAETRKRLPNYADIVDDPEHRADAFRQMAISKLDSDASNLLQEALVLNKALGDPRLSADNKDPQVVETRRALQQLYDAQMTRANILNEFVTRERVATARNGLGDDSHAFDSRQQGSAAQNLSRNNPNPAATSPPNMPRMTGIALADKNQIADWGASIASFVYTNENQAAKAFLPIARSCR